MEEEFPWLSLDDDEEVVWSGGPRQQLVLWTAVPALVVPIVIVFVWTSALGALAGLLAWAGIVCASYLYVENVEYIVSTKYVYAKRGILWLHVTQVGLHNIQDTTLRQGIFGTQFDHGTVSFSTAGGDGTALMFYVINDPKSVNGTVDRQINAVRRGSSQRDRGTNMDDEREPETGALDELIAEFRATRQTAQRIDEALEQRRVQP